MTGFNSRLWGICNFVRTSYPRFQHVQIRQLSQHRHSGISSCIFDYHLNGSLHQRPSYQLTHNMCYIQNRHIFSSIPKYSDHQISKKDDSKNTKGKPETEEKLTVFQRFKKTYKEHGKVLVGVHVLTSTVWFGSFFYAAKVGVDVIPVMEWLGFSEKIISPFRNSSAGDVAVAYLMYKLATPARYTVTLAGTNFAIKYLRQIGKMQPKTESSSLRTLAKDSRKELREKRRAVKKKTSQFEDKFQKTMKATMKKRQAYVKATFTKFRSKLRDKHKKNGKHKPTKKIN